MKVAMLALLTGTFLLTGCGTAYLKAPVPPQQANSDGRFDGTWSGEMKSAFKMRMVSSPRAIGKALSCDTYHDRISIQVNGGNIQIQLGSNAEYRLNTILDSNGQFYQSLPLNSKSNSAYGEAKIWVAGQLDASTNIAKGQISVSPPAIEYGCLGDFQAERGAAKVSELTVKEPFSTDYRFVQMRDNNN